MAKQNRSKKGTTSTQPEIQVDPQERVKLAQLSRDAQMALFTMTQASAAAAMILQEIYQWSAQDAAEFTQRLISKRADGQK